MALLQDEPTISRGTLLLAGIPSFILAVAISLLSHQQAHRLGEKSFCGDRGAAVIPAASMLNLETPPGDCGLSALTGQIWTFGLAIVSFALLLRFPRNLFLMSMAFVNATARLPEAITLFLQYLINSQASLRVDESVSLSLMGLTDPTIPTVIMCFYSILLLFFSIIVVHDVRAVRYKWPIALGLFLATGFIESGIVRLLGPGSGA